MDLQHHLGTESGRLECGINLNHRDLNEVGGGTLDRRIDRVTLSGLTDRRVARIDVAERAAASEDRLGIALLTGLSYRGLHEVLNLRIKSEVRLDQISSLLTGTVEPLGESERRDTVDNTEVDHLAL